MSTSLYYTPCPDEPIYLGKQLKYHLAPKYWQHDGTLAGEDVLITTDDLPFLQGLLDEFSFRGHSHAELQEECLKLIRLVATYNNIFISLRP